MAGLTVSGGLALGCSLVGVAIAAVYLLRRPPMDLATRLWLVLGLGILPLGTAFAGSASGMHASKQRHFCSSCHVMHAHTGDANDPLSQTLAARHSRNPSFGEESCYACHADYGLFGTVVTKMTGMVHVAHYLEEFHSVSLEDALPRLHLFSPYPNRNCMQCHTATNEIWRAVPDHAAALPHLQSGEVSCASAGCHGYAHPFTKTEGAASLQAAPGEPVP